MRDGPGFLDEDIPPPVPAAAPESIAAAAPPLPSGPRLLEPDPDAPATLQASWQPQGLSTPPSQLGVPWTALGVVILITGTALVSMVACVLDLAARHPALGLAAGLTVTLGLALILRGAVREVGAYRRMRQVARLRTTLQDPTVSLETLRAAALDWLDTIAATLPDTDVARQAIHNAASGAEVQAAVQNRLAEPLRQAAHAIGRRAALQGAGLVAISPHASWDGVIAGLRGVMILREVARLFGLRPGWAVTVLLLRRVAWTAASTAGVELLSQSLADHTLSALPVVRHIASAVPGSGVAAIRLYRIARLTAEACCPLS